MPTVPRRDQSVQPTAPVPGVRVPVNVPRGTFGTEAVGPDISGFTKEVGAYIEAQRQKADTTALLDADNQLARLSSDLSTQAQQRKGRDAMAALGEARSGWDQGVSQIEQTLNTDQQREAFHARVSQRFGELYSTVESHAAREADAYHAQTAQDALTLRTNTATQQYDRPDVVATSLAESKAILADYGRSQGWSPETLAEKQLAQASDIHVGVLARYLNSNAVGAGEAAATYYAQHKDEIVGTAQANIEHDIRVVSVRGVSQGEADRILATHPPDLYTAIQEASHLADPEVRQAAQALIRQSFADQETSRNQVRAAAFDRASQIIEDSADITKVPPSLLRVLSPAEKSSLADRIRQIRNPPRENDDALFTDLMNRAALNSTTAKEFRGTNLLQYRNRLDEAHYDHLVELQLSLRRQHPYENAQSAGPVRLPPVVVRPPSTIPAPAVDSAWVQHAKTDPAYQAYLDSMGVKTP
jgi:hypothetical protein